MDARTERLNRVLAESERLRRVMESAAADLKAFSKELMVAARALSAEVGVAEVEVENDE